MPNSKQDRAQVAGREGLPTGEGTAGANDVADPHPSTGENYDKIKNPGRVIPPKGPDIGPNSYAHDDKVRPLSKTPGNKPK
jgi:hypothetical protein